MTNTQKTAVALGFFDGLHPGHTAVIEKACAAAEKYGFKPGAFMIREQPELPKFGGRRDSILIPYPDKVQILEERFGIRYLYVPFFESIRSLTPEEFFERDVMGIMNAGYVCCGENFRFGKGAEGDNKLLAELCGRHGILCEIVPPVCIDGEPVSSTMIRDKIREGDVSAANKLMIRPLTYTMPVITGKQLGRTIGFPTINQEIPPFMVHAGRGVYASRVTVKGTYYPAITNIGTKPTVKSDDAENMETHIIGFEGDLYGRAVSVELLAYIRGERRFDSLAELKAQLEKDKHYALTQVNG